MFTRREFLRTSTLVALAPTVPVFLAQTARAADPERDGRVLVVIQLDGGNDGINTVVPFADDGYAKHRKVLRQPTDRLFKINKEVGLHPAMGDAAKLLESGRLAIVQGVGYPNPSRSHFKSMAIWHSANVNLPKEDVADAESKAIYGWIGQALDGGPRPTDGAPGATFVGTGAMPAALRSRRSVATALTRPEDLLLNLKTMPGGMPTDRGKDLAAFVERSTLDAYATSARMAEVLRLSLDRPGRPASGHRPAAQERRRHPCLLHLAGRLRPALCTADPALRTPERVVRCIAGVPGRSESGETGGPGTGALL
jgi:uncharacterized protein (DUF1501 family)